MPHVLQWVSWDMHHHEPDLALRPPMQGGQKCGASSNFWEYYEEDIARVVSLNSTVFRLSLGAAHPAGLAAR